MTCRRCPVVVVNRVLAALIAANGRAIAVNSTSVVVQRTEVRPAADGGVQKIIFRLGPFQGRLIPRKGNLTSRQDEAGIFVSSGWVLVAPGTPLLLTGDVALIGGKDYTITRVLQRVYAERIYAQHADVEEVKP
ncbi:MAG: hypothetical protein DDT38_01546 [Firmicutes bacterium]|nr:hypothetical protein [candidate division NPL-UPA2 bacterium]